MSDEKPWTKHAWSMASGPRHPDDNKAFKREYLEQWVGNDPGPYTAVYYGRRSGKTLEMNRAVERAAEDGKCVSVATSAGPVVIKSDPTVQPGSMRIEGSPDGKNWHVIGVDFGSEPSRSVVTTTCARCSATIDPAAVEQHHERCFVVGDWVRGEWRKVLYVVFEGEVTSKPAMLDGKLNIGIRIATSNTFIVGAQCDFRLDLGDLRHIQRPGQADLDMPKSVAKMRGMSGHHAVCHRLDMAALDAFESARYCTKGTRSDIARDTCWIVENGIPTMRALPRIEQTDPELADAVEAVRKTAAGISQPTDLKPFKIKYTGYRVEPIAAPTLYDGLTAETCYMRWCENRSSIERGEIPMHGLTPDQISVGRGAYQSSGVYSLWSAQLRARISDAKERERCRVRVDDQGEP